MPARPNTGRPYFVMELVRGIRITEYCDQNKLSTASGSICSSRFARRSSTRTRKGIIHRDIKPSNILVTLHDGVPVPKVIDFGIAKATEGQTDRQDALHRVRAIHRHAGLHEPGAGGDERAGHRHAQRHLQPGRAALRIADRAERRLMRKELLQSGLDEMRRTIREKEPPRPSTRLSTLDGRS